MKLQRDKCRMSIDPPDRINDYPTLVIGLGQGFEMLSL